MIVFSFSLWHHLIALIIHVGNPIKLEVWLARVDTPCCSMFQAHSIGSYLISKINVLFPDLWLSFTRRYHWLFLQCLNLQQVIDLWHVFFVLIWRRRLIKALVLQTLKMSKLSKPWWWVRHRHLNSTTNLIVHFCDGHAMNSKIRGHLLLSSDLVLPIKRVLKDFNCVALS